MRLLLENVHRGFVVPRDAMQRHREDKRVDTFVRPELDLVALVLPAVVA